MLNWIVVESWSSNISNIHWITHFLIWSLIYIHRHLGQNKINMIVHQYILFSIQFRHDENLHRWRRPLQGTTGQVRKEDQKVWRPLEVVWESIREEVTAFLVRVSMLAKGLITGKTFKGSKHRGHCQTCSGAWLCTEATYPFLN